MQDFFFTCGSSSSVRVGVWGSAATWLTGTLDVSSVQGHGLPQPQDLWTYQSLFFQPLVAGDQKASLVSLSPYLHPFRHLEGSLARGLSLLLGASGTQRGPLPGIPLCRLVHQAHKGAPCVWSYSVVQGISCLMGQPLYCSAASAGVWGNGSTPYTWLSSITLLPWLPSFPPQAFFTTISFLMSPQSISPESTSALTLGLLHNPYAPVPSCCAF